MTSILPDGSSNHPNRKYRSISGGGSLTGGVDLLEVKTKWPHLWWSFVGPELWTGSLIVSAEFRVQKDASLQIWMGDNRLSAGLSQQSLYQRHHPLESHLKRWECSAVGKSRFTIALAEEWTKSRDEFSVSHFSKKNSSNVSMCVLESTRGNEISNSNHFLPWKQLMHWPGVQNGWGNDKHSKIDAKLQTMWFGRCSVGVLFFGCWVVMSLKLACIPGSIQNYVGLFPNSVVEQRNALPLEMNLSWTDAQTLH